MRWNVEAVEAKEYLSKCRKKQKRTCLPKYNGCVRRMNA